METSKIIAAAVETINRLGAAAQDGVKKNSPDIEEYKKFINDFLPL